MFNCRSRLLPKFHNGWNTRTNLCLSRSSWTLRVFTHAGLCIIKSCFIRLIISRPDFQCIFSKVGKNTRLLSSYFAIHLKVIYVWLTFIIALEVNPAALTYIGAVFALNQVHSMPSFIFVFAIKYFATDSLTRTRYSSFKSSRGFSTSISVNWEFYKVTDKKQRKKC